MKRSLGRMRAKHDDIAQRLRRLGIRRRDHTDQAGTTLSAPDTKEKPLHYDPLSRDRTIRVLDLAPGTWEEPVSCSLRTVHLDDDNLGYEAISYTWGDSTDRKTIVCNGSVVSTTRNLFEALQRFRNADTTRTLWADALCINQSVDEERTAQVQLMRFIYQKATRVLIWLQHDDDQVVRDSLNVICRLVCKEDGFAFFGLEQPHMQQQSMQVFYLWRDIDVTSVSGKDSLEVTPLDALQQICSSPWFGRGWVVQEVVLSRFASVFWGHAEIRFEWLVVASMYIAPTMHYLEREGPLACAFLGLAWRAARRLNAKLDSFLTLIYSTTRFEFREPKDRIYGLLGLPTLECDPADGSTFVHPDYDITTVECYRRVAEKLLSEWHDLRVLSWGRDGSESTENWPSWVPDWKWIRADRFVRFDRERREQNDEASLVKISEKTFGESQCIEISGFRVDTVDQEVKEYANLGDLKDNLVAPVQLQGVLRNFEHTYSHPYLACTFGNWYKDLPLDSVRLANLLSDYYAFMEKNFVQNTYVKDRRFVFPDDLTSSFEPSANRFFRKCVNDRVGRTLFITNTEMLGLGPEVMHPGDIVVVLHGGSVPFVLRPAEDGLWRLVGECYLYEVNNGRCRREWEEKGSVSEKFCIC